MAVAVPGRSLSPMALSVSGPLARMTDRVLERAVPLLVNAASRFAEDRDSGRPSSGASGPYIEK